MQLYHLKQFISEKYYFCNELIMNDLKKAYFFPLLLKYHGWSIKTDALSPDFVFVLIFVSEKSVARCGYLSARVVIKVAIKLAHTVFPLI